MNCPRCNVALKKISVSGVELDFCGSCEGVWFDATELDRIYKVYGSELGGTGVSASLEGKAIEGEYEGQNELPCPRCQATLDRRKYAPDLEVLIDGCSNGCGLWLDDGELGQIVQYIASRQNVDNPEKRAELLKEMLRIEREADQREAEMIDNMVKADNVGTGLTRQLGVSLQGIYRVMWKLGI